MDEEDDELDHLQLGEVPLPPQIRLHPRAKCCQEVVEVHGNMHGTVQEPAECGMASSNKSRTKPNSNWQPSMVDNMEGGEVVILLAKKEEERVKEVNEL